jgi:hypothetical protein
MPVEHQDVTVETGLMFSNSHGHITRVIIIAACHNGEMENSSAGCSRAWANTNRRIASVAVRGSTEHRGMLRQSSSCSLLLAGPK